jgi:hypothetical protein
VASPSEPTSSWKADVTVEPPRCVSELTALLD